MCVISLHESHLQKYREKTVLDSISLNLTHALLTNSFLNNDGEPSTALTLTTPSQDTQVQINNFRDSFSFLGGRGIGLEDKW